MKILFVCNSYGPFKTDCGASQRSFFIMRALEKLGDVDVLLLSNNKLIKENVYSCICDEFSFLDKIKRLFYRYFPFSIFYLGQSNGKCTSTFNSLNLKNDYDIIFFRYLQTYLLCGAPQLNNMFLDMDDVPWVLFKQFGERQKQMHWYFQLKYRFMLRRGKHLNKRFKTIFYPNYNDAILYKGKYLPNIPYVSNNLINYEESIDLSILFVGWLEHKPNLLGVDHFLTFIWPNIVNKHKNVIFKIIGRGLPNSYKDKWTKMKNVKLLGFVESLEEEYNKSTIVVCPIFLGSGSNIKVVEALAYKKICIVSDFALRGYEQFFMHNKEIVVCKNDEDFINSISFALDNPDFRRKVGEAGFEKVNSFFSEAKFCEMIKESVF